MKAEPSEEEDPGWPISRIAIKVTVQQAAARLGVVEHALYYWIRCRRLPARKDPSGRWLIPWSGEVEAACRDWITHPEQFALTGPRPLPVESAREGETSIPQAAARLGVLDAAVRYQIGVGHLPAHRTPAGRIAIPWDDQVEAALRGHLARRGHPGPTGLGSPPLLQEAQARGELSIQQVATRLGVRQGAVYYSIARGRLDAHRADDGRLSIPWTSDNEARCLQLAARTVKSPVEATTLTAGGAV